MAMLLNQDMYGANQSSMGCGRHWNSRYPSHRAVVPSIHGPGSG